MRYETVTRQGLTEKRKPVNRGGRSTLQGRAKTKLGPPGGTRQGRENGRPCRDAPKKEIGSSWWHSSRGKWSTLQGRANKSGSSWRHSSPLSPAVDPAGVELVLLAALVSKVRKNGRPTGTRKTSTLLAALVGCPAVGGGDPLRLGRPWSSRPVGPPPADPHPARGHWTRSHLPRALS